MLLGSACNTPPTDKDLTDRSDLDRETDLSIVWTSNHGGSELGVVMIESPSSSVPVQMAVGRRPATDEDHRVGTLIVNPGGPGLSGVEMVRTAQLYFPQEILDRFDIVSWDPRGVGATEPSIDCVDSYDAIFDGLDTTPDDDEARQRLVDEGRSFAQGCEERTGEAIQHVSTNQAARDIDAIRRALGEDRVSYFGFSYGAELGAVWATMFPDTVRAAVLDGAVDPRADAAGRSMQRAVGFERAIGNYLATCGKDPSCAFYNDGQPAAAFDLLMAELDDTPIPSKPGRPAVTREIALEAVAEAMYSQDFWDQLSRALANAQRGAGAGLLQLWDAYYLRQPDGTWPNTREAGAVIGCMDQSERPTMAQADTQMRAIEQAAPRYAPGLADTHLCGFLPKSTDTRVPVTGEGAGPIVVIGTTGDPATPLPGSEAMADALEDGRMVVVDANRHTGYGANRCVDDIVSTYLIELRPPADRARC